MKRKIIVSLKGLVTIGFLAMMTACGGGGGGGDDNGTIASAGTDQNVVTGSLVTLDGSASQGDGELVFDWSFASRPTGSAAAISNPTAVKPTFTADVDGVYLIDLIVTANSGSDTDSVKVTAASVNSAPVANAGIDRNVATGSTVTLDGSASNDANGDTLTYAWGLTSKPAGSNAVLSASNIVKPTFIADKDGAYVFSLVVNDGSLSSIPDSVTVTATTSNSAPVANAGPDQNVATGSTVTLDGSASSDADGNLISYLWSLISKPVGSTAVLSNINIAKPSFTPDLDGDYLFRLVVNDGTVNSTADNVIISAWPYTLSGKITSSVTGVAMSGVTVTLTGNVNLTTTTDSSGRYGFSGLPDGAFTITPSLDGSLFDPDIRVVTINGNVSISEDFVGLGGEIVGENIEFLPQLFSSRDQLRVSLLDGDGTIVYTDSSNAPLKKQALDGSPPVALANRFLTAEDVVLYGGDLYWIEQGDLYRKAPGGEATLLVDGRRMPDADVTSDIVVDGGFVYWVDAAANQICSPPCVWEIQKVPVSGGVPVVLATVQRRVDSLKADADHIYWEEGTMEPWEPGCDCGSKISVVSKAGGPVTILVDGSLNGTIPVPPPGQIAGTWMPTGGIALTNTDIIFAAAYYASYVVKSIPLAGGAITDLVTIPSSAGNSINSILDITVSGEDVFWIDIGSGTLDRMPVTGGQVITLADGLTSPGALALNTSTAFWTDAGGYAGCCLAMGTGAINQVPLSGGIASTLVDGLDNPRALSAEGPDLAFTEQWRIAQAPSSGGAISTMVSGISSDMPRIAVAQSMVYILDEDLVKVVPLSGGAVEKFASARFGTIGDFSQINMDIVADNDAVYWAVRDIMGAPVIQKLALAGGDPVILASEASIPYPQDCYWRIALDQQSVYWSAGSSIYPIGCAVKKVSKTGGSVTTLVDQSYFYDFTVDGQNVYFASGSSIQKVPVGGGTVTTVTNGTQPLVMANYGDRLYWLNYIGNMFVETVPKTGGDPWVVPLTFVTDPYSARDGLLVNDNGLFFSEIPTGTIYRLY